MGSFLHKAGKLPLLTQLCGCHGVPQKSFNAVWGFLRQSHGFAKFVRVNPGKNLGKAVEKNIYYYQIENDNGNIELS